MAEVAADRAKLLENPSAQAEGSVVRDLNNLMMRHHYAGDALIEILHAAQQLHGYLSPPLLNDIARKLRLPPSKVLGVATFYHLFRFTPPEKHTASVCLGTACYVEGAAALADTVRKSGWRLEIDRCAGACGLAPLVVCDGVPLSRVTSDQLERHLLDSTPRTAE